MKIKLNLLLLLIVISGLFISASGKKIIKEADLAYSNGNYKEAISLYEQYLANKPKKKLIPEIKKKISNAYFYLGGEAFTEKKYQEAINLYKESTHPKAKEKISQSYFILGEDAFAKKDYENAINFFFKSVEQESKNKIIECHLLLGDDLFSSGKIDDAILEYNKSSELIFDDSELIDDSKLISRYEKVSNHLFKEKEYQKVIDILDSIVYVNLSKNGRYIFGCCYLQIALFNFDDFDTCRKNLVDAKLCFEDIKGFKDSGKKLSIVNQKMKLAYERCGCDCAEITDGYTWQMIRFDWIYYKDVIGAVFDIDKYTMSDLEKKHFLNSEKGKLVSKELEDINREMFNRRFKIVFEGKNVLSDYELKKNAFKIHIESTSTGLSLNELKKRKFGYRSFWFSSLPIEINKTGNYYWQYFYLKFPEDKAWEIESNKKNLSVEICFKLIPRHKICKHYSDVLGRYIESEFIYTKELHIRIVDKHTGEVLYGKVY